MEEVLLIGRRIALGINWNCTRRVDRHAAVYAVVVPMLRCFALRSKVCKAGGEAGRGVSEEGGCDSPCE